MIKVKWPFGPADVKTVADAAAVEVAIDNQLTFMALDTMAQATTLNLTVDAEVTAGARLVITAGSDGTARALTPGTGMTGTAISGTISKSNVIVAEYNGTAFVVQSARLID
jgi:hypothetical protein